MAHKIVTFYNVDNPVGTGSANTADDVTLVRFLLRRIGDSPDNQVPSLANLAINSTYGPDLHTAILDFQKEVKRRGGNCAVDGRVNTAKAIGHGVTSAVTGTQYTIAHMNGTYRRRYPQYHDDITKDPKCPGILTAKFSVPTTGY
jgi:hypothetical protein